MIHIAPKSPTVADKRRIDFAWVLYCRRGGQRSALRTRVATAASKLQRAFSATQQDSAARSDANASARRSPDASPDVGRAPIVVNAQSAARSLFAALNHRDVSAVLSLLADDVTYENLGSSAVLRGRAAVGRFYLEALAALPEDAMFVLEGSAGPGTDPWVGDAAGGPVLQAGVAWRVQLNGMEVPLSRGVGVYWADPRTGRLSRIWDNPEHTVKQAAPSLTSAAWSSPLLRGLGPLVIPAAASVGSFLTNLGPGGNGGGGGDEAAASNGGGGGGGGGLAGSVMSTLSSMMPFQSQGPAAAAAASRGGGGESSSRNGGGSGGGGSNPGGGRNAIYRDHTRVQANGGRAFAAAAVASAAATAAAGGGGGVRAGLSAVAAKTQLGSGGPRPMRGNGASTSSSSGPAGGGGAPAARGVSASAGGHRIKGAALTSATTTAATTAAATTTASAAAAVTFSVSAGAGGSAASGLRTAVTAPSSSAAAAPAVRVTAGPASAAASATTAVATATAAVATATAPDVSDGVALSSSGEPIRMRPLPAPAAPPPPPETAPLRKATAPPLSGASVSVASSLASLDDGGGDAKPATTPDQDSVAVTATTVTAAAASPSSQESGPASDGIHTSPPDAATSSDSKDSSKDSGKDNKAIGGGGSGSGGGGEGGGTVAFGSVDSGSDTDGGGGGGSAALPFAPSASLSANLTGLWEKDLAASQVQEYESMLDVLELGGLQKVTARLIDGIDVRQDDQRFEIGFVTVVPFFRVTEKSRFGGATTMMRRDLRSGRQTAQAARIPGGVCVHMSWEAPMAGSLWEEYVASEDGNRMAVTSTIRIGARSAVATQVYRRSGRNKSDFLASKRSSYGSMEDVLKSQEKKYGKINY